MLYSVFLLLCLVYSTSLISASAPRLIFSNRRDIQILRTAADSRGNETIATIVSGLKDAIALGFDYKKNTVFWTDVTEEKIKSTVLGSGNISNVVSVGLKRPEGLAVDWTSKKIYWTDSGIETKRIEVSNYDGKNRKVLFWENLDQPRAIAVDPRAGYMFWNDWGKEPKIERAGMDGSDRTVIVNSNVYWPNGLTIDYEDRKIYWTDAKMNHIESTNYNGKRRRNIVRRLPHPFALSLYGHRLYWTDWSTRSIHSCEKNTGHVMQILKSGIESPMDIIAYELGRQPGLASSRRYCEKDNGGCSHLCLLSPRGYSCACPTGVQLLSDKKTCEQGPRHFLLLARRNDLRRISLDTPDHTDVVLPITGIKYGMAVDFDPMDEYIYWSDGNIKRAKLDGTDKEVVAKIEDDGDRVDGIAVDWIARNLYWTDVGMDRIEVIHLSGSSRKVLIKDGLKEPRAIAVDPGRGYLFWTDWGKNAKIERADLDGGNRVILVNTSVKWPNGLTIDYEEQQLYWADAKLDKIQTMDFNGNHRRIIADRNLPHVFGLTLLGDNVYWTDWKTRTIAMVNKRTGKGRKKIIGQLPDLMGIKAVNLTTKYALSKTVPSKFAY